LLDRLRVVAYREQLLNVDPGIWNKVMSGLEREGLASLGEGVDPSISNDEDELA
jgi:protein MAK16